MSFRSDTSVTRIDDRHFTAELPPNWLSLVGIHGGYSAAVLARAIAEVVDDNERRLRTITTHFAASPEPGPADITVDIERSGRSMTTTTARMTQGHRLLLLVTASSSLSRDGLVYDDLAYDGIETGPGGPGDAPRFFSPFEVRHFGNAEIHLDPETVPFSGAKQSRIAAWIRPLEGEAIDAVWLTAICDILPPSVFTRTDGPMKSASVDYFVHIVAGRPQLEPGEYVYLDCRSEVSNEGFAVEDATLWGPGGKVLALARQSRLAG